MLHGNDWSPRWDQGCFVFASNNSSGKKIPIPKTFTVFESQGRKKVEETQTQIINKSVSKQQVHDEISSRIDASHIPNQYLVHKIIIF